MVAELSVDHLHGSMGVTEKIKKAMYDAARQFVYIGFLLYEVKQYKYFEEGGYRDVYDYAEKELGFKKSSTKNFIAICEQFGVHTYSFQGRCSETMTMHLQQEYKDFKYAQLCEMLSMSDKQKSLVTPDMSVRQIREIKKSSVASTVSSGQTSGLIVKTTVLVNGKEVLLSSDSLNQLSRILNFSFDSNCIYSLDIDCLTIL